MKSRIRKPSGALIKCHGKRDNRLSGLKKGTRLSKTLRVWYLDQDRYACADVLEIVSDHRDKSSKRLQFVTRLCTVLAHNRVADQRVRIRVLHRTKDNLVGVIAESPKTL